MKNVTVRKEISQYGRSCDAIIKVAEKNELADYVALNLSMSKVDFVYLKMLDQLNMRGFQIELACAYVNAHTQVKGINGIIDAIKKRDQAMIDYVNQKSQEVGFPHKAVNFENLGSREYF